MISKSTRRRRRLHKENLAKCANLHLRLIDKRCDAWLISYDYAPKLASMHVEVYGRVRAQKLHSYILNRIRSGERLTWRDADTFTKHARRKYV